MGNEKGYYQSHNNTRQGDAVGNNLVFYVNSSYGEEGCAEDKIDEII
jgi:hypothetical protein